MVLARRVGQPRSWLRGFLLTVVTAGIYAVYWNYRAPNEVYRQFELAQEGRDEGVVWYILGLLLPPLLFVYLWTMAGNVQYVRARLLLPERGTQPWFVGLVALGFAAYFAGAIVSFVVAGNPLEAPEEPRPQDVAGAVAILGGVLAFLVTVPWAYLRLQHDINEVWGAYDRRLAALMVPPAPPAEVEPPAPQASAPQAPRYWADLPPPREP